MIAAGPPWWGVAVIAGVAGVLGAIIGAVSNALLDFLRSRRERERRIADTRRPLYESVLTMWQNRVRMTYPLVLDPYGPPPPNHEPEMIDKWEALMKMDASDEVRRLSGECNKTILRLWNAYETKTPVDVDEYGLFRYDFDRVRGHEQEGRALIMRMSIGSIHDELSKHVDALADQIRNELAR